MRLRLITLISSKILKSDHEYRVIGTFEPGKNAPKSLPDMQKNYKQIKCHIQILLKFDQLFLEGTKLNIWLQFLLDCPIQANRFILFNLYRLHNDIDTSKMLTKKEIKNHAKVVDPVLPAVKVYLID